MDVGDVLAAEISEDGIKFTRVKTAHDHAMEIARAALVKYGKAFEILAKS
jgi:hypothetical protein